MHIPLLYKGVNHGHVYVCTPVRGTPQARKNNYCNYRKQSCKVRGLLVDNMQTTGHNPPVAHTQWTHNWKPSQPELPPSTWLYKSAPIPFITLWECVLSAHSERSAHLWSNRWTSSSVMDDLIDSLYAWHFLQGPSIRKLQEYLFFYIFSFSFLSLSYHFRRFGED